jgi:hypothetical protein
MAKAFVPLTRPAMRKLLPGEKISEHGITFERLMQVVYLYTADNSAA